MKIMRWGLFPLTGALGAEIMELPSIDTMRTDQRAPSLVDVGREQPSGKGKRLSLRDPFCTIRPAVNDASTDLRAHEIVLHYGEPNTRTLLNHGRGIMSKIICQGDLPDECRENRFVGDVKECPACHCNQSLDRDLDFGYNNRFWTFVEPTCKKHKTRFLHIGVALSAFVTYVAGNCPGSHNDVIDLDPRAMFLAKTFFGGKWDDQTVISCEQGVKNILAKKEKYNFVVLDVYNQLYEVPTVCRDDSFANDAFDVLSDQGCLLANLWEKEWGASFDKKFGNSTVMGNNAYRWCKSTAPDQKSVPIVRRLSVKISHHSQTTMVTP